MGNKERTWQMFIYVSAITKGISEALKESLVDPSPPGMKLHFL